MEIRQLRHVAALADHGNFRRAAEELCITQPALTKSIQNLEAHFEVQLFERRSDGVVPTAFGEAVVDAARRILPQVGDIDNEIELLKGLGKGRLHIGCDPSFAEAYMSPVLGRLMVRHPSLRIRAEVLGWDIIMEQLEERKLDLVIGVPVDGLEPPISFIRIAGFLDLVYFCRPGHPLLKKEAVTPKDGLAYSTVGIKTQRWWLQWFAGSIDAHEGDEIVIDRNFVQCDSVGVCVAIVKHSDCISGGPRDAVAGELANGTLCEVPFILPPYPEQHFGIAYRGDRIMPPAARVLIDELLAMAEEMGMKVDHKNSRP